MEAHIPERLLQRLDRPRPAREEGARYDGHAGMDPVRGELQRLAFERSPVGMGVASPEGRWLEVNAALCRLLGSSREELLDADAAALPLPGGMADLSAEGRPEMARLEVERRHTRPDGSELWIQASAAAVAAGEGEVGCYIVVMQDVTGRRLKEERLRTLSLVDDLTGLYNRRAFLAMAAEQYKLARRHGYDLLLLFVDIDAMKWINDTFGHLEGDRAIRDVAEVLRGTFRESDLVARLGGDEFAVLASDGASEAGPLIERLRTRLTSANEERVTPSYQLTLSVGSAVLDPREPSPLEELLAQADARMYLEKIGKTPRE